MYDPPPPPPHWEEWAQATSLTIHPGTVATAVLNTNPTLSLTLGLGRDHIIP